MTLQDDFLNCCPPIEFAQCAIENALGYMHIPLGVVHDVVFNDKTVDVYMATEEESVIAAVGSAVKFIKGVNGTISTKVPSTSIMVGQVQVINVVDIKATRRFLEEHIDSIKGCRVDEKFPIVRVLFEEIGGDIIVYLHVSVGSTMGARRTIMTCERVSELFRKWNVDTALAILSNYASENICTAELVVDKFPDDLGEFFANADRLATLDVYRATTNNKGIMNGITAILTAVGNDTRAVEAGAHAWAATALSQGHGYGTLSRWTFNPDTKRLYGRLEMPLQIATKGGMVSKHPTAQLCLKKMGIQENKDLMEICVSVGILQNFAALRGMQRGFTACTQRLREIKRKKMLPVEKRSVS